MLSRRPVKLERPRRFDVAEAEGLHGEGAQRFRRKGAVDDDEVYAEPAGEGETVLDEPCLARRIERTMVSIQRLDELHRALNDEAASVATANTLAALGITAVEARRLASPTMFSWRAFRGPIQKHCERQTPTCRKS